MKRLFSALILLLIISVGISAKPYSINDIPNVQLADRSRYTSSPDGILSEGAVAEIDRICDSLHTAGIAQIAVVAVRDIASDDVFTFAHRLFSSWGVGSEKNDNGLGIILVLDKREIRFVTGYGLEGVLPDAICKRIQQNYMVGPLGDGDYDKGMVDGVKAVASLLTSGELPAVEEDELSASELAAMIGTTVGIILLMLLVLYLVNREAHRCPKCRKCHLKQTNSQVIANTISYQLVAKTFVCPDCNHKIVRQSRISKLPVVMTGGGHGRGGFGGGSIGGGFGGGRFGGGGAGSRF